MHLVRHSIFELSRLIAVKLCHMISICVLFIMQVWKSGGGLSPKKIWSQKHAKFGAILHNFDFVRDYRRNESRYPKIGQICDQERFLVCSVKQVWWTLVHYPESRTSKFGLEVCMVMGTAGIPQ